MGWLRDLSAAQIAVLIVGLAVRLAPSGCFCSLCCASVARCWHAPRRWKVSGLRKDSRSGSSDFALPSLDGNTVTSESLRAPGKPEVLLFTTPECGPFVEIFPQIERWQAKHSGTLTIAIVSEGDRGQNATMASEHALTIMLLQEDWEVGEAYGADWTPSAVLVHPDGTIGSPMHGGTREVMEFLARTGEKESVQQSISP